MNPKSQESGTTEVGTLLEWENQVAVDSGTSSIGWVSLGALLMMVGIPLAFPVGNSADMVAVIENTGSAPHLWQ